MKTQKFGSDYQTCAHAFAYASRKSKGENYQNRMFYENDVIYSYGYHFPIAKKVRNKEGQVVHILFTNNTASVTTSKQINCVERALHHDLIYCSTDLKSFNPLEEIKTKELELILISKSYEKARADHKKTEYLGEINRNIKEIIYLMKYYRIKSKVPVRIKNLINAETNEILLALLGVAEKKRSKAIAKANRQIEKRRRKAQQEQIQKEQEQLSKWRNHDVKKIYLNHIKNDALRLSVEGSEIETSQGIKIPIEEGRRLLTLLERGKIIGATVDQRFKVKAFTNKLTINCHNFTIDEINNLKEQL